jgi:tetratricopeptide (TPR) repeat protein
MRDNRKPTEDEKKQEVGKALEQASIHRKEKRFQKGRDLLLDALRYQTEEDQIYYQLGNIYYDAGALDQAEDAYQQAIEREYPGIDIEPCSINDIEPCLRLISALSSVQHNRIWKYAMLDIKAADKSEKITEEIKNTEAWPGLSYGARSALRLFIYDEILNSGKTIVEVRQSAYDKLKMLYEQERAAQRLLPSIGIEIQTVNITEEDSYAWKRVLEYFDIPSPRRLEFHHMVEAAFKPARSPHAYLLAIPILHRMGLHEHYRLPSAFHISIAGDLGDETKYIAFLVQSLKRKEEVLPDNIDSRHRVMTRVMSKGLVYRNRESQQVSDDQKTPIMHTEIRVSALQNLPDKNPELDPLYTEVLEMVQHLSAALHAYNKAEQGFSLSLTEEQLSKLWQGYRHEAMSFLEDERYKTSILLDANIFEATGDPVSVELLERLDIIKRLDTLYYIYKDNNGLAEERKQIALDILRRYNGLIKNVVYTGIFPRIPAEHIVSSTPDFLENNIRIDTSA